MKVKRIEVRWEDAKSFTKAGYEIRLNEHIMTFGRRWFVVAAVEAAWRFFSWRLWERET